MRKTAEVENEIKKLRLVMNSPTFSDKAKDNAWAMMLALQWTRTKRGAHTLTPMELSGITMEQANALKKVAKRTRS